jgi:VWFA-related protein
MPLTKVSSHPRCYWAVPFKTKVTLLEWLLTSAVALALCGGTAHAQFAYINAGPDSGFSKVDFAEMYLDRQNREMKGTEAQKAQRKQLVDSGTVSELDLRAPDNAIEEFNRATTLIKAQNAKEAISHLQKAIAVYPKFVSAHNALGLAYLDQEDARAKGEFEAAAKLDDKFPGSFLNLGLLAIAAKDFPTAEPALEKAASLNPRDGKTLSALAFAQNGNREYKEVLITAQRAHATEHHGMANVHYIAAAAAMNLHDLDTMQRELQTFLGEDPTNPLAPVAHRNLDALAHRNDQAPTPGTVSGVPAILGSQPVQTFPNSERLEAQLNALKTESDVEAIASEANVTASNNARPTATYGSSLPTGAGGAFTIRKVVDETALFFAVSKHGKMVSDLELSNIQIKDDNKPPQNVLLFMPQSKLPLRLGLVIDTSGSVESRFSFEKRAAAKFLEKILNGTSDLGFVAGFSHETTVTQDFTATAAELGKGIDHLTNGGGTALFDAVSLACWKLAAYPEQDRVARVLIVLSDGEDNSSHRSLKQSIQDAEAAGVTVYAVSTRENPGAKTDADRILEVLAERSGGEAMFPVDMHALGKSLDQLRELIRSRYLIAYKAADFQPDGKYRTVHITAERDGQKMRVHARKGYFARVEAPHN